MSEHQAGPSITRGHDEEKEQETPPHAAGSLPGAPQVEDTSGPGDNPPGPPDVTDPFPTPPPLQVPSGSRRLQVAWPTTYFDSGVKDADGVQIVVSSAGTDVPDDQVQAVLEAAQRSPGVTVKEAG